MPYILLLLVLAGLVGGGLSVAANEALPGDPLYAFKLSVNEPVEELLATSDAARATYHLERMAQCLTEAQALATQSRLTTAAQTQLSQDFSTHADAVAVEVNRLNIIGQTQAAADLASRYRDLLAQQATELALVSSQGSWDYQVALAPVLVRVRTTLASATVLSKNISAQAAQLAPPVAEASSTALTANRNK